MPSSKKASRWSGPSIGTDAASPARWRRASARSAAPPAWSRWPWVSRMRSTVTPASSMAARMRSASPPGSTTMACFDASSHRMAQFCWKGVTGTIAPRRFAMRVLVAGVQGRSSRGAGASERCTACAQASGRQRMVIEWVRADWQAGDSILRAHDRIDGGIRAARCGQVAFLIVLELRSTRAVGEDGTRARSWKAASH